ncbi:MAG: four helix bundle protein [Bacteroidales bacterium]
MKKSELEDRLIRFSVSIIEMTKGLEDAFESQHLSKQIIRSGTATALLYGEAQGAPTKKDFIHKISLVLRELRETHINLRIINQKHLFKNQDVMNEILDENNQLISIFTKTYQTSVQNEGMERLK